MSVQSIIFKKKYYKVPEAKRWLFKHNYRNDDVDIKKNYIRFRQQPPSLFGHYFIKNITPSIKYVIGY